MQENCTFSIIPYGITMSKIFSFLFIVPNDSTTLSFPLTRPSFTRSFVNRSSFSSPHPCRAQLFLFILFLGLVPLISRSSVGGALGTLGTFLTS